MIGGRVPGGVTGEHLVAREERIPGCRRHGGAEGRLEGGPHQLAEGDPQGTRAGLGAAAEIGREDDGRAMHELCMPSYGGTVNRGERFLG